MLHGRPAPLNGKFFANIFVHFIPTDHDDVNARDKKVQQNAAGHESFNHEDWEFNEGGHYGDELMGQTELHRACQKGDIAMVKSILNSDLDQLNARDSNGWQPIHEAVHGGHLDIVKFLVSKGAQVDERTNNGGTPLWWAKSTFRRGHAVITYLQEIGASDADDL